MTVENNFDYRIFSLGERYSGRPTTKDTRYNGTQLGDEGERARGTREKIHRIMPWFDARTETERSATKEELTDRGSFFY